MVADAASFLGDRSPLEAPDVVHQEDLPLVALEAAFLDLLEAFHLHDLEASPWVDSSEGAVWGQTWVGLNWCALGSYFHDYYLFCI